MWQVLTPNMIFYVLSESAWQLLVQFFVMFQVPRPSPIYDCCCAGLLLLD